MISINFFGFCDAPPIKNTLIEEICFKIDIFFGFTDPPYKTIGFFILNLFLINFLICITWFSKSLDFGTRPVPIDHTGS